MTDSWEPTTEEEYSKGTRCQWCSGFGVDWERANPVPPLSRVRDWCCEAAVPGGIYCEGHQV